MNLTYEQFEEIWSSLLDLKNVSFSGVRPKEGRYIPEDLPELGLEFGGDTPTAVLLLSPHTREAKRVSFELAIPNRHLPNFSMNSSELLKFAEVVDDRLDEAIQVVALKMAAKLEFHLQKANKIEVKLKVGAFETFAECDLDDLKSFLEVGIVQIPA